MDSCVLCTCGGGVNGQWIGCENADCPIEWYHWKCVGILLEAEGDWLCPRCRAASPQDDAVSPQQKSSIVMLPGLGNTKQTASKEDQQESNVAAATEVGNKRRKSQRSARIIYETTEASIFENIIAESQETVLKTKAVVKMHGVAKDHTLEDQKEDPTDEESIELLVRKMRAKVERQSRD